MEANTNNYNTMPDSFAYPWEWDHELLSRQWSFEPIKKRPGPPSTFSKMDLRLEEEGSDRPESSRSAPTLRSVISRAKALKLPSIKIPKRLPSLTWPTLKKGKRSGSEPHQAITVARHTTAPTRKKEGYLPALPDLGDISPLCLPSPVSPAEERALEVWKQYPNRMWISKWESTWPEGFRYRGFCFDERVAVYGLDDKVHYVSEPGNQTGVIVKVPPGAVYYVD